MVWELHHLHDGKARDIHLHFYSVRQNSLSGGKKRQGQQPELDNNSNYRWSRVSGQHTAVITVASNLDWATSASLGRCRAAALKTGPVPDPWACSMSETESKSKAKRKQDSGYFIFLVYKSKLTWHAECAKKHKASSFILSNHAF